MEKANNIKADYRRTIIITEGVFDSLILEKVLPDSISKSNTLFLPSSGFGSAISKAKSLAVRLEDNILLILDADTVDTDLVEEKKEEIEYIFRSLGKEDSVKVFLFKPKLEVIFLQEEMLRSKLNNLIPLIDLLSFMKTQSKTKLVEFLSSLTEDEIKSLRENTALKGLIEMYNTNFSEQSKVLN